jgi:hypothetical protein
MRLSLACKLNLLRLDHKELWTVNVLPPRGMCGKLDQKITFNADQE